MNTYSKYRPLLDKVELQISRHEAGVHNVYQIMLEALDKAEESENDLQDRLSNSIKVGTRLRIASESHVELLEKRCKLLEKRCKLLEKRCEMLEKRQWYKRFWIFK